MFIIMDKHLTYEFEIQIFPQIQSNVPYIANWIYTI